MSFGLNVLTVALMLVVFASTAGITGGEVAIAGGSAVVGQKLLETIFGEDTVRRMAAEARTDLNERLHELLSHERGRYYPVTDPLLEGTTAADLAAAADGARGAVAHRFPELGGHGHGYGGQDALAGAERKELPGPSTPALPGPATTDGAESDAASAEASADRGPLRDLFTQLRGGFRAPEQEGDA